MDMYMQFITYVVTFLTFGKTPFISLYACWSFPWPFTRKGIGILVGIAEETFGSIDCVLLFLYQMCTERDKNKRRTNLLNSDLRFTGFCPKTAEVAANVKFKLNVNVKC